MIFLVRLVLKNTCLTCFRHPREYVALWRCIPKCYVDWTCLFAGNHGWILLATPRALAHRKRNSPVLDQNNQTLEVVGSILGYEYVK
jgi:hypothetical protein